MVTAAPQWAACTPLPAVPLLTGEGLGSQGLHQILQFSTGASCRCFCTEENAVQGSLSGALPAAAPHAWAPRHRGLTCSHRVQHCQQGLQHGFHGL